MSMDKTVKNSLLNFASTGFSIDDFSDARLLAPAPPEEKPIPEATDDIDLQSEGDDSYGAPGGPLRPPSLPVEDLREIDLNDPDDGVPAVQPAPEPSPTPPLTQGLGLASSKLRSSVSSFIPSIFRPLAAGNQPSSQESVSLFTPADQPNVSTSVDPFASISLHQQPLFLPPSIAEVPQNISANASIQSIPFMPVAAPAPPPPHANTSNQTIPMIPVTSVAPISRATPSPVPLLATAVAEPLVPTIPIPMNVPANIVSAPTLAGPPPAVALMPSKPPLNVPASPVSADSSSTEVPPGPPQGAGNKYRLGQLKLQYAQYPGLMPNSSTAVSGQLGMATGNAPPLMPPAPPVASQMYQPPPPMQSPSSPSFVPEYVGTGELTSLKPSVVANPTQYIPVTPHWFYLKDGENTGKAVWKPFSFLDSTALEQAFIANSSTPVPTNGGRYDVNVMQRLRSPVYWEEAASQVRRCSWFYKGPLDSRYIPYEEEFADEVETEYKTATSSGIWHRRVELGGGEAIILHNSSVMLHFCQAASPDEWGSLPESQLRPRVVKRGVDKSFSIDEGESSKVDHLVFLVHGIGAICDFKFRTIIEAVDDFRGLSTQLLHTHFASSMEQGMVGRVEFLPVCWHTALHGDCGVDKRLKPITLPSIPKLRHFTNDTLLDILFYTSPVYCQRIVDTVGNEINRMYDLYLNRNTDFDGSVSLAGHSLGSLIVFDLMSHQPTSIARVEKAVNDAETSKEGDLTESGDTKATGGDADPPVYKTSQDGTGQPSIKYPAFDFHPTCVFALGSPTAVFVAIRGIETLGTDFHFPTCSSYFNIFHPYDPVAYRMEPLIDPLFEQPPVTVPHHKGRKRYHLELKDAMVRMGTDVKQTVVDTLKSTWKTVSQYAHFGRSAEQAARENLEMQIDRAIAGEIHAATETELPEVPQQPDIFNGQLNNGRRIDFVLQEAPLESFNEYLFAIGSHVCYWESEDTMLFILKEIYQNLGITSDNQVNHNSSSAAHLEGQKSDGGIIQPDPMFLSQSINPGSLPPPPPQPSVPPAYQNFGYGVPAPSPAVPQVQPESHLFGQPPPLSTADVPAVPMFYSVDTQSKTVFQPPPISQDIPAPVFQPLPTAPLMHHIQPTLPSLQQPPQNAAYGTSAIPSMPPSSSPTPPQGSAAPPPPLAGFQRR